MTEDEKQILIGNDRDWRLYILNLLERQNDRLRKVEVKVGKIIAIGSFVIVVVGLLAKFA